MSTGAHGGVNRSERFQDGRRIRESKIRDRGLPTADCDTAAVTDGLIELFGDAFDPLFYRVGEQIEPGVYGVEADVFLEIETRAAEPLCFEFEADDAIATAAVRWVEDVEQVVIATPDKGEPITVKKIA